MGVYAACNAAGRVGAVGAGWAIPMATDIAFAMAGQCRLTTGPRTEAWCLLIHEEAHPLSHLRVIPGSPRLVSALEAGM
jgi:hypothetical protein